MTNEANVGASRSVHFGLAFGLAAVAVAILLTFTDPTTPARDLDTAYAMASDYALSHRLVFGQEFVFNFGPYSVLATRQFNPATWRLVLAFDAVAVIAVFWTAFWNRSVVAVAGLGLCFIVLRLPSDALSPLALFGVFLVCLQRQKPWAAVFLLLSGPILLSKLSFGLVLAPLVLLADAERLIRGKAPYLTLTAAVSMLLSYVAIGQPLDGFPTFLLNAVDLMLGYGRAMQIPGPQDELVASVVFGLAAAAIVGSFAMLRWRESRRDLRPVVLVLGFLWFLLALFKMSFVRQDIHTIIFHMAAPAALAMAVGALDLPTQRTPVRTAVFALSLLVALSTSFYWRSISLSHFATDPAVRPHRMEGPALGHDAKRVFLRLGPRLQTGLKWASGGGVEEAALKRREALAQLARSFPSGVSGTVDVIPWDLAPVIASGLRYSPRPVPQSYQSNTPALQRLDADHFAGPKAPETLLLRIEDIDGRLPSLALGPSLPVIGRRYDAVGQDSMGLILHRRPRPRPMSVSRTREAPVATDSWIPVPAASGKLVMANIRVERSLAGRALGFFFREPIMTISLRTSTGREATYRFVPGMAETGVAVSPLPTDWTFSAPVLLDPDWPLQGEPVRALRLNTGGGGWAFRGARAGFTVVAFEPGFAAGLGPSSTPAGQPPN